MKAIVRVLAICVFIGVVWYIATQPDPVIEAPTSSTPTGVIAPEVTSTQAPATTITEDGWQRYDNIVYAFSIQHPKNFIINENYRYTALGPKMDIPGIAFKVPENLTAGTNLSADSGLSVERISPAPADCSPLAFIAQPRDERIALINGREYIVADSSEAAAGNLYEETVYATSAENGCYALRLFMHSTNIENYDPGTVSAFDRAALLDIFLRFRNSFGTGI